MMNDAAYMYTPLRLDDAVPDDRVAPAQWKTVT